MFYIKAYFYLFNLTGYLFNNWVPICIYKQYIDLIVNLPLKYIIKHVYDSVIIKTLVLSDWAHGFDFWYTHLTPITYLSGLCI